MFKSVEGTVLFLAILTMLSSPFIVYWACRTRMRAGWIVAHAVAAASIVSLLYYESRMMIGGINNIRIDAAFLWPAVAANIYILVKAYVRRVRGS